MKSLLLKISLLFCFFASFSSGAKTLSELVQESNALTTELQAAIQFTNLLDSANAARINKAFIESYEFIDSVVQDASLSNSDKLTAVSSVAETIAACYGDLAEPFTDLQTARVVREGGLAQFAEYARTFGNFWLQQFQFTFVNWFRFNKDVERPTESLRRVGIGKNVFSLMMRSTDLVTKMQSASPSDLAETQRKILASYQKVLQAGLQSEPYKYRHLTRGVMITVGVVCGYFALSPQWLQEMIVFLPANDFFFEKTLTSAFFARVIWTLAGTLGYLVPRLSTGYGVGNKIAALKSQFEAIRKEGKIQISECELPLSRRASDTDSSAYWKDVSSRRSERDRRK